MNFHVLTLFPEQIKQSFENSIMARAVKEGLVTLNPVNIRDFSLDKNKRVDDYVYGGGAGMLIQAQPVYDSFMSLGVKEGTRVIYLSPQGKTFNQKMAAELSKEEDIVFLCGHYEGIDERVIEKIVTDKVSIGDFILTGGEMAAVLMMDSIARLIPGVLGNDESSMNESFSDDLLEHRQYTRPSVWMDAEVPDILLSGDHKKIEEYRLEESIAITKELRNDLYEKWADNHPEYFEKLEKKKRKEAIKAKKLAKRLANKEQL